MTDANAGAVLASARRVTKTFGTQRALDDVGLDIHAGEALGLLGPNGAGKSTLINLLTGLRRPNSGRIELFGLDPLTPAARVELGVTPQATAVPPTLKVIEAVNLVSAHYPDPVPGAELLEQFGLTEAATRQCGALSGGQQRRLLVALALVGRPRLVVLDEPSTGLDVEAREILWERLREYRRQGGTLLITSHYLAEIEALADRVVVIDHGRVIADGSVEQIRSHISVRQARMRTSVEPDVFTALDGVVSAARDEHGVTTVVARDSDAFVREIVTRGYPFEDLEVHGASLEEAFKALTATSMDAPAPPTAGIAPSSPDLEESR